MKVTLFLYICNMSTFGKKALLNWDYSSIEKKRFNNSDKNLQLEILKKWYPIGEHCYMRDSPMKFKFTIIGYEEHLTFYSVIMGYPQGGQLLKDRAIHPLNLYLPMEILIKRDKIIENLLR